MPLRKSLKGVVKRSGRIGGDLPTLLLAIGKELWWMASKTARVAARVESRSWTSTPIPISVTQRTSAMVLPPVLAGARGAATSFVDAPATFCGYFTAAVRASQGAWQRHQEHALW
jgi:hypothetical protein